MPADYESTAQGLAVSPSRTTSSPAPSWSRLQSTSASNRLHSNAPQRRSSSTRDGQQSWYKDLRTNLNSFNAYSQRIYNRLTPLQRFLAIVAVVAIYALLILGWIYSHALFDWLASISAAWRALPGGWLILFLLIFISAFPPMIGYSTLNTIAGFVYGFPYGWPIVAVACTLGSLCAFIASRTVFSKYVDRMVGKDARFVALGQVLKRDGILYLTGIRFCPLPFSLSNGFLATIPSISPWAFTISTALSSPKLLVHVFIGSRLAILADSGDKMSFLDKAINYLSMLIGATVGGGVGWIVYKRTMARAAEVAREDGLEEGNGFLDAEGSNSNTLMDPEDAAALMTDDDVSLWETSLDEPALYHDEHDDGKSRRDGNNDSY